MKLEKGRPESSSGREQKEIAVYDLLDSLGIEYYRIDHEPAMTIEACAEIDRVLDAAICKNLFLCPRNRSRFYLLMLPGEKKLVTKDISAKIGSSRLHFAKNEDMEKHLNITPGSVSVMGLMNDSEKAVQLVMDKELLLAEYIGFHPCVNTTSIKVRVSDLMEKILPATEHEAWLIEI